MNADLLSLLLKALGETVLMVMISGSVGLLVGGPIGIALYVTQPGRLGAQATVHHVLGLVVNIGRSVPFIILLMAIVPFTRVLTGTSIGVWAAIVPLSVGAIPFVARLVEAALQDVPSSLIEAARSLGATRAQVIVRVVLPEAAPGLIQGITLTLVSLINYSAMAGAVGGGGLGDLGIRYGYQRFDVGTMVSVVVLLVGLVQILQFGGDRLARAYDRRG